MRREAYDGMSRFVLTQRPSTTHSTEHNLTQRVVVSVLCLPPTTTQDAAPSAPAPAHSNQLGAVEQANRSLGPYLLWDKVIT